MRLVVTSRGPYLALPRRGRRAVGLRPTPAWQGEVGQGRVDRTCAAAEPGCNRTECQGEEAEQRPARDHLRRRVGRRRRLLPCPLHRLAVLLLVAGDLRASLVDRNVLRLGERLCGPFARILRLGLV